MNKYEKLSAYVSGKISEMCDCEECNVTDHELSHLEDLERYIETLNQEEPK